MTPFEQAVLEVLAASTAPMGWYSIELRLSMRALDTRPPLPEVLLLLTKSCLIQSQQYDSSPTTRYELTELGRAILQQSAPPAHLK
jgi:hypothetical protein